MEDTEITLPDNHSFFVPLLLTSAVFFSVYLYMIVSVLAGFLPGSPHLYFHGPGFTSRLNGNFFFAILMVISFIASTFLIRELKKRSLSWTAGLLLCIVTGIIALSLVSITFYELTYPLSLKPFTYAIAGEMIGYALLPASAAYFLSHWKKTFDNISGTVLAVFSLIGCIGGMFLLLIPGEIIPKIQSQTPRYYDVFQISLGDLFVVVCLFFYAAILLPYIGLTILKISYDCWNSRKQPENTPVTPP